VGARILIIEDNPANLELMTYLLSAFGHTVLTAEDGHRGLEAARGERPDLIVCDVQLPDMDGHEVARWLKSDPQMCATPLVAVTALAMVGDRDRVLAAGFDGYLAKPINPEKFVRQMETYLRPDFVACGVWRVAREEESSARATRHAPRAAILVVDNLPVNLELARSILEPSGYKVITAGSMAEGLARAREAPCDLILSDVCMSGGTGFDFIRAVKADPRLRAIPFVFITSTMLDEQDRARGLALGAARFILRPIDPEAFLDEIRACLSEKGPPGLADSPGALFQRPPG
jgi:two-component system cell cycle response regulator